MNRDSIDVAPRRKIVHNAPLLLAIGIALIAVAIALYKRKGWD
jgi:hypothetical protein